VKRVLVLDNDSDRYRGLRLALMEMAISTERALSELAAYWRITALPSLDALVLNVAQPECMDVALFARRVIPSIRIVYLGAHPNDATPLPSSWPPGQLVAYPLAGESLICALCDNGPCVDGGPAAQDSGRPV
jgi:hypothetical protein